MWSLMEAGTTNPAISFGIWVGGNVGGVTIANLTIRDIYYHPIIFNTGTQSPLVHNVTLINAGQPRLVHERRRRAHRPQLDDPSQPVSQHPAPQGQLAGPAITRIDLPSAVRRR